MNWLHVKRDGMTVVRARSTSWLALPGLVGCTALAVFGGGGRGQRSSGGGIQLREVHSHEGERYVNKTVTLRWQVEAGRDR